MNRSSRQRGNGLVVFFCVVFVGLVVAFGFRTLTSYSWFNFLISPDAAVKQELEALEVTVEELKEENEELKEKLAERMEDDDREQDAGRRLFFRN